MPDPGCVTRTRRPPAENSGQTGRRIPINAWHSLIYGSQPRLEFGVPTPSPQLLYNDLGARDNRSAIEGKPGVMLNEVYNRRILELAGNIPRIGRLAHPDATATAHSKLCGSTVTIDLKMEGDTVTDFAHDVKACALGQASSSIMARHIVGANAKELRQLREDVRRMLTENGPPPRAGRWADVALLEPVRDYKARHASTLLTFDAVVCAVDQIAAERAAPLSGA
jgi:NifU-like protein involved in Fe-S cluster formation